MLYAIIAAAVIVLDQYFKYWITTNISYGMDMAFLPGILHLTNVNNTGAAFSFLRDSTWLLIVITFVFIVALIVYLIKGKQTVASRICIAAVIGGAVGNFIDRVRLGYVVDMFEVEFMHYAIFNVADCFIVVGVIVFCILFIFSEAKAEKALKAQKDGESNDSKD